MGTGVSVDRQFDPRRSEKLLEQCLRDLPAGLVPQTAHHLSRQCQLITVTKPIISLVEKNAPVSAIYIVNKGKAYIGDGFSMPLTVFTHGDYCGELPFLFPELAGTENPQIFATKNSEFLLLPAEFLEKVNCPQTFVEWLLKRKILMPSQKIPKAKLAKTALKETEIFARMGESVLDALILRFDLDSNLILCPPRTTVIASGDPCERLVILLRGRCQIISKRIKDDIIITATGGPRILCEEDFFLNPEYRHHIKVTDTSLVLFVPKCALLQNAKVFDPKFWNRKTEKWNDVLIMRHQIPMEMREHFHYDVFSSLVRQIQIFEYADPKLISTIFMKMRPFLVKVESAICLTKKEFESGTFFILLKGNCVVEVDKIQVSYTARTVVLRCDWMGAGHVTATTDCLLAKVGRDVIMDALQKYPDEGLRETFLGSK